MQRSGSKCELCTSEDNLSVYDVAPSNGSAEQAVLLCDTCRTQIDSSNSLDVNHWRCLNDSMWTPEPAVQVMAWRMLKRLSGEGWAQDLLDMLYLEDDVKAWAEAGIKVMTTPLRRGTATALSYRKVIRSHWRKIW